MALYPNRRVPVLSLPDRLCLRAVAAFCAMVGGGYGDARYSPAQLLALGFNGRPLQRRISNCGIERLAGSSKNTGGGYDHSRYADESHE
jgi:hypothetical protein